MSTLDYRDLASALLEDKEILQAVKDLIAKGKGPGFIIRCNEGHFYLHEDDQDAGLLATSLAKMLPVRECYLILPYLFSLAKAKEAEEEEKERIKAREFLAEKVQDILAYGSRMMSANSLDFGYKRAVREILVRVMNEFGVKVSVDEWGYVTLEGEDK